MSDFDPQREPDVTWPPTESQPRVVPGRTGSNSIGATIVNSDEFRRRRSEMVTELEGRGGGADGGDGSGPVDLPDETPPTDHCAHYLSFRYGHGWGIYIGLDCWFRIASFLRLNGVGAQVAVDEAFSMLCRHENFHYEVDKAVLLLERAVGKSTGRHVDHWIPYVRANNPSWLEEALANANAFQFAGKSSKKPEAARVKYLIGAWMKHMPPGYRDFDRFVRSKDRNHARSQLLSDYLGIHRGSTTYAHGFDVLLKMESFTRNHEKMFRQKFEIQPGVNIPLDVHFF